MLGIFEITLLNGKRTRKPYDLLINNRELPEINKKLSDRYKCDVYATTVQVKDEQDWQSWKAAELKPVTTSQGSTGFLKKCYEYP